MTYPTTKNRAFVGAYMKGWRSMFAGECVSADPYLDSHMRPKHRPAAFHRYWKAGWMDAMVRSAEIKWLKAYAIWERLFRRPNLSLRPRTKLLDKAHVAMRKAGRAMEKAWDAVGGWEYIVYGRNKKERKSDTET